MPNDRPAPSGHNSQPLGTRTVPLADLTIWGPAANLAADVSQTERASELEMYAEVGQRQKPIARYLSDGSLEVVANAHIVEAAREHCREHPDASRTIKVEIVALSDEQAFQRLALDVERPTASALARGRFFAAAVKQFEGVSKAARACRVSKAAVSKNLAVARCGDLLAKIVLDPRNISQRNAAWLLQQYESDDEMTVQAVRAAIAQHAPGTAAPVFRALRRALSNQPRMSKNRRPLAVADQEIGEVRVAKGRIVSISFANAGDVTPGLIAKAVQRAFEDARNQAN